MTVDCWVDTMELFNSQSVDETLKRLVGSQFPAQGVKIRVGHLPFAKEASILETLIYFFD